MYAFVIRINGKELKHCESYKYLGVYFDNKLSWKPQIEHVCKKISKACGALAKTRHFVGEDTLVSIYYALINSYVRYGVVAWGNASAEVLKPLHSLINRAMKIMAFSPFGRVATEPIYDYFNILNIDQTFTLECGKFIFKSKNALLPISTIASHFSRETSHRPGLRIYNTGASIVPFELLSVYAKKSIQHKSAGIWDNIPISIRNLEFFGAFKRQYKKHLLSTA